VATPAGTMPVTLIRVGLPGYFIHVSTWLGWAYLTKKVPHAATTPIATAFKICVSHRENWLSNRLPTKVSFSVFD
jgi:hypothetical protein